jgi:hypothetical protein
LEEDALTYETYGITKSAAAILSLIMGVCIPMCFTLKQATVLKYKSSYSPMNISIDSLIVEYGMYFAMGLYFDAIIPEESFDIFWGILS